MSLPRTSFKKTDILAGGGLPISCKLIENKLVPALEANLTSGKPPENLTFLEHNIYADGWMGYNGHKVLLSRNGREFSEMFEVRGDEPFILESRTSGKEVCEMVFESAVVTFTPTTISSFPFDKAFTCGAYRCGRLFAADKADRYMLRWSGEGGIRDWQEGISGAGWIRLQTRLGRILKIFDFGGELVVLREYGITRLNANGTPENFAVKSDGETLPKVEKLSAVQLSDRILFCAGGELYSFKGGSAEKVKNPVICDISAPQRAATPDGRRYFLCALSKFLQKKVVYVYDPAEDSAYIVDTPLDFIGGHGEIMGMSSDYIYSFGKAEKLEFISSPHIFGTRAKKTLWTVEADCPSPVEIDVAGGGYLRTLSAPYGRAYAHLRSRQFVFFVRAGDEVRSLSAKAEVIDEV